MQQPGSVDNPGESTDTDAPRSPENAVSATTVAPERPANPHANRVKARIFSILSVVSLVIGFGIIASPFIMRAISETQQHETVQQTQNEVAGWPYPQAENQLKAARAYNAKLAQSGQTTIGEVRDPFASTPGQTEASGADDSAAARDTEYQSLLDTGQGVMGSIRIPKIDVNLPIYHGTSDDALAVGAGHLYGTSLPVGGKSTHAVITGHRGLPNSLLFTRLDEMKVGDSFYIDVMGEELGYKVDRISVITPDDSSKLRIKAGEDRVTLMTCTPYGVNTHRLLVSAVRASIPNEVPEPDDIHAVNTTVVALVSLAVLFVLLLTLALLVCRRRWSGVMRHSTRRRVRR
ncbi:class C sortase [Bifidobacterium ramosum]|nr:class C sortase [Bifidobacterium ramosum]NEG71756.1 class C sortase [Bifidobacterium ramosum]